MADEKLIYILEHRVDYKSLYALNFLIYTEAKIKCFESPKELLQALKYEIPNVMIINSLMFPEKLDYGQKLAMTLKAFDYKPKVLYLGDSKAEKLDYFTCAPVNYNLKKIVRYIAKALSITAKDMAERKTPEYYPIPLEYVLPGWYLTQDVFKNDLGSKIKLFGEGEIFQEDALHDLEMEGQKEIYVKSVGRVKFVNSFTTAMVEKLKDDSLSINQQTENIEQAFTMVKEQVSKVGITESAMEVADAAIDNMVSVCENVPKLDQLLASLRSDLYSVRYRHCMIVTYISTYLLQRMPWSNKDQVKKLSFMSFFHDISLEQDQYVLYRTDQEVDKGDLSWEEKTKIKNHAKDSAKIVSDIRGAPLGVDTLIKQHHGCKDGNSLNTISMSISPLAVVFVLAEEWTHLVLDKEDNGKIFDKDEVIKGLNHKYRLQTYKKVIPYLNDLEI